MHIRDLLCMTCYVCEGEDSKIKWRLREQIKTIKKNNTKEQKIKLKS